MGKKVSDSVVRANRENSKHSTGPVTVQGKTAVSRNALKHGVLARNLTFKDDREEEEYYSFLEGLERDQQPRNFLERMALEELAVNWFRRGRSLKLEQKLYRKPNPATEVVEKTIGANSELLGVKDYDMPEFSGGGWECEELSVAGQKGTDTQTRDGTRSGEVGKEQNFQLRAKFASPLETALRYQRATGKDFYKALNKFLSMRRQRKPGN